jgi:DNA-binding protein H-NS
MKKSNENTELTKSKLKEMVRKEIKSLNEKHPHDDEAFLDIIQKAEDFGKAFSKYAHGSSQEYTKDANRIIGKSLKQYNKFNDHLKALYKELLKQ